MSFGGEQVTLWTELDEQLDHKRGNQMASEMQGRALMDVLADYDAECAEAARDEAIDRVEANADRIWTEGALEAVRGLALCRDEFTTDDVWDRLEVAGYDLPRERRAMGAVMRQAARDRLVVKSDRVVNSRRVECHARPVAVWRSVVNT